MENIKKSKENKKLKLKNKSFYILTNNKKVIGVCKFNEFENSQFLNIQNIGSFIKE
jgi:N-acetylglutamate synthase-like GNAT family acetyltransferase